MDLCFKNPAVGVQLSGVWFSCVKGGAELVASFNVVFFCKSWRAGDW